MHHFVFVCSIALVSGLLFPNSDGFINRAATLCVSATATADCTAFVHKCGERCAPTFAYFTDAMCVRYACIGHVDLIEFSLASDLTKWTYFNTRCMHVKSEVGHALVLRSIWVCTCNEHSPVGKVSKCVPHFLSVDDPLVSIANRFSTKTSEVASGTWLRKQLTPFFFASKHGAKEALLYFVASVCCDSWTCESNEECCGVLRCCASGTKTFFDVTVEVGTHVKTAVASGEMNPCKSSVEPCSTERDVVNLLRVELCEKCIECRVDAGCVFICGGGCAHSYSLAVYEG